MKIFYGSSISLYDDSDPGPSRQPRMFRESLARYGIEATNLTLGVRYASERERHTRSGSYGIVMAALRATAPGELVLFTDAWDVFFAAGIGEMETKFKAFGRPFVFSTELILWPEELANIGEYPPAPTRWRYINGGGMIGYALALEEMYFKAWSPDGNDPRLRPEWSNQQALNLWVIRHPEDFAGCLDHQCSIFQTLAHGAHRSIEIRDGRIYNAETGQYPCVVHGQGGHAETALRLWEQL